MISERKSKQYCLHPEQVENYHEAVKSSEKWICHHRLGLVLSIDQLKKLNLYYHRPAIEFLFIKDSDHKRLHGKMNKNIENGMLGKHHSKETRMKLSKSAMGNKNASGYKQTEEHKRKRIKNYKGN